VGVGLEDWKEGGGGLLGRYTRADKLHFLVRGAICAPRDDEKE